MIILGHAFLLTHPTDHSGRYTEEDGNVSHRTYTYELMSKIIRSIMNVLKNGRKTYRRDCVRSYTSAIIRVGEQIIAIAEAMPIIDPVCDCTAVAESTFVLTLPVKTKSVS
jgi:hypothetical protein